MSNLIKVYSHPRSGTHYLQSFLARNFYPNLDLSSEGQIHYGHWSNKLLLEEGEPHMKISGDHFFPEDSRMDKKMIYIYRDGRAVIASLFNSFFYNNNWEGISFSEYLRKSIDWKGGPGQKKDYSGNIVQHWFHHVDSWNNLGNNNLLIVNFEELKLNPVKIYLQIAKKFYPRNFYFSKVFGVRNLDKVADKVGIKPNQATIHSWKNLFSQEDLNFFYSQIPHRKFLYEE